MICWSLLVVCALQGTTWARTLGIEDGALLTGVVPNKGSLLTGVATDKGSTMPEFSRYKELSELILKGITEAFQVNGTGDINGGLQQASISTAAKEFAKDLQEWIKSGDEGRHFKRHKMMARMAMWLKTLLLGVVLPGAVALALFAAWKGITLSLMALLLAGIVGLKGLVTSASKSTAGTAIPQHVVVSGLPTHHHHQWRRTDHPLEVGGWSDSHNLAYRAYA